MDCVSPPLPAKPTRGYSWMCSQCMHDRVSRTGGKPEDRVATIPMTQIALARASRGKAKEKSVPIDYDKPDAFFRGWNFRYFGCAFSAVNLETFQITDGTMIHSQYTVVEHSVGKSSKTAVRCSQNSALRLLAFPHRFGRSDLSSSSHPSWSALPGCRPDVGGAASA